MSDPNDLSHEANGKPQEGQIGTRHQKEIRRLLENMRRARSESRGGDTELPGTGAVLGQDFPAEEGNIADGRPQQPVYAPVPHAEPAASEFTPAQPDPVYPSAEPAYHEEEAPISDSPAGEFLIQEQENAPEAVAAPETPQFAPQAFPTGGQPAVEREIQEFSTQVSGAEREPGKPLLSPSAEEGQAVQEPEPRTVAPQRSRQPIQQEPPVTRGNFFSATAAKDSRRPQQAGAGARGQSSQETPAGNSFVQQATVVRPTKRSTARVSAQPLAPDVSSISRAGKPAEVRQTPREQGQAGPSIPPQAEPAMREQSVAESAAHGPFSQRAGVRPANNFQTKSDVLLNRGTAARREQAEAIQVSEDDSSGSQTVKPSFGRSPQARPAAQGPAFGPRNNDKTKKNIPGKLWEPPAEVPGGRAMQTSEERVSAQPARIAQEREPSATMEKTAVTNVGQPPAATEQSQAPSQGPQEQQQAPAFSRSNLREAVQEPERQISPHKNQQPDSSAQQTPTQNRQAFAQQAGTDMRQEEQAQPRQRQASPQQGSVEVLHGDIQWGNSGGTTFEEKSAQFAEAYRAARKKVLSNVPPSQLQATAAPAAPQQSVSPPGAPTQAEAASSSVDSESVNAMYEALAKYRASLNRGPGPDRAEAAPHPDAPGGAGRQETYQQEAYAPAAEPAYSSQAQAHELQQQGDAVAEQQAYAEYYAQNEAVQQAVPRAPEQPGGRDITPREPQPEFAHPEPAAPQQNYVYITDNVEEPVTPPGGTDTLARTQEEEQRAQIQEQRAQMEEQRAHMQEQRAQMYAPPQETPAYAEPASGGYDNAPDQRGMPQEQLRQQQAVQPQQQNYIPEQQPQHSPVQESDMHGFSQAQAAEAPREPVAEPERQPEPVELQSQQTPGQYQPHIAAGVPQGAAMSRSIQETAPEEEKKSWKAGKLLSKIAKPSDSFGSPASGFPVPQSPHAPTGGEGMTAPVPASGYPGGSWVWQPGGEDSRKSWFKRHPVLSVCLLLLLIAVGYGVGQYMAGGTPSGPKIAVINVEGMILDSAKVVEWTDRIRKDDSYKGAILRINSPGGAVGASQEIFAAVKRLDQIKPVVASMGSVAASGGYYAALGAREIYSGPSTLTAGIGVKMQIPNVNGLMQTLGVSEKTLSTGNLKDAGSAWRTMSPEEESYFYELLNDMYVEFMQTVAEQRKISMEDVQVLADGGAMTGRQALGAKLVDQLGDQHDAVERLKVLCNMKPGDSFSIVEGPQIPANKLKEFFLSLFQASMEHKASAEQPKFFY